MNSSQASAVGLNGSTNIRKGSSIDLKDTDLVNSRSRLKEAFGVLEGKAAELGISDDIVHSGAGEFYPHTGFTHCLVFKNRQPGDMLNYPAKAAVFVVDIDVDEVVVRHGFGTHGAGGCNITPGENEKVIRFPDPTRNVTTTCPSVAQLKDYFEHFLSGVLPTVTTWSKEYIEGGGLERAIQLSGKSTMPSPETYSISD